MGHQQEPSESADGFSAAEAVHHNLLNQVLDDDGRSGIPLKQISAQF
jgi:hypothetical protein